MALRTRCPCPGLFQRCGDRGANLRKPKRRQTEDNDFQYAVDGAIKFLGDVIALERAGWVSGAVPKSGSGGIGRWLELQLYMRRTEDELRARLSPSELKEYAQERGEEVARTARQIAKALGDRARQRHQRSRVRHARLLVSDPNGPDGLLAEMLGRPDVRFVPSTNQKQVRAAVAAYVGLSNERSVRRIEGSDRPDPFEIDKRDLEGRKRK